MARGIAESTLLRKMEEGCSWKELRRAFDLVSETATDTAYVECVRLLWMNRGSSRRVGFFVGAMGRRSLEGWVRTPDEMKTWVEMPREVPVRWLGRIEVAACKVGEEDGRISKEDIFCVLDERKGLFLVRRDLRS